MSDRVAAERLYLNEARDKVVPENDPEARFLLAAEGDEIPEGYDAPRKVTKAAARPADKAVDKPADK